jgi:hypothetical protein
MNHFIDNLEKLKCIKRASSKVDMRAYNIRLINTAAALHNATIHIPDKTPNDTLKGITAKEIEV